jgi:uncharacterized membrane protein YfcA
MNHVLFHVDAVKIILFGLCMGFLSGLLGVGGGFLITPLLNVLFGIPYNIAVGSSICQMALTSLSGSIKHVRQGNADVKLAIFLFAGSFVGVEIGASILEVLKSNAVIVVRNNVMPKTDFYMSLIYLVFLLTLGFYMFKESFSNKAYGKMDSVNSKFIQSIKVRPLVKFSSMPGREFSFWLILLLGLAIGIASGLLGVGGGVILLPILIYVIAQPTHKAIGTSLFLVLLTSVYGSITHVMKGNVDVNLVTLILCGSIIGSYVGAAMTTRLRGVTLRKYFCFVVFLSAVVVAIKLLL